ncbi:DUF881 domain-containing protein [Clostridium aestuarii]|uniref:DUF881 domain-containing protein n=1 Tax=Clostridium aestuarii TaxID=338193 RepID=A0ABT4CXK7_9CLOT|nr:DUF881 domain-containing protein [Clostridium aestuarii]MCY6483719.1 DUF881 domain-containing protein [Clostridium aestuarii]
MRKICSQISVAIVCILLGFMITYQLKAVINENKNSDRDTNAAQITLEIEQLKKQKDSMEEKINELQIQIKDYERAAANNDEMTKQIVRKLEDTRILTGSVDVEGEGVTLYITPQNDFFGNSTEGPAITDSDLVRIVNELNAADAEAISINDIRITSRTGIRNASNYITINEERISPYNRITIKAIGDKNKLKNALEFPGVLDVGFAGCDIKYDFIDKLEIHKYNKNFGFKYAKPIKNN